MYLKKKLFRALSFTYHTSCERLECLWLPHNNVSVVLLGDYHYRLGNIQFSIIWGRTINLKPPSVLIDSQSQPGCRNIMFLGCSVWTHYWNKIGNLNKNYIISCLFSGLFLAIRRMQRMSTKKTLKSILLSLLYCFC